MMERNIGVWVNDKKSQRFNWNEFIKVSSKHGYNIRKLNLEEPLETQGKIDIFLHKLTDILAASIKGDEKASCIINQVERYLSNYPNTIVIDPLNNVRILLNRCHYYTVLQNEFSLKKLGIFTPKFVEFVTDDINTNWRLMQEYEVKFPVICKPTMAHGSKSAHEMILVFNKKGLKVCKPPCVVQSFVNHNAVLHKVYVIGNRYHVVERPSVKNFYASENLEPIHYSTSEVCKVDSKSTLSILDPNDPTNISKQCLDEEKVRHIVHVVAKSIGLILMGIDVVIDNITGHHAVIDINVFPSYDKFPDTFDHLLDCIDDVVRSRKSIEIVSPCEKNTNGKVDVDCRTNGLVKVGENLSNHKWMTLDDIELEKI